MPNGHDDTSTTADQAARARTSGAPGLRRVLQYLGLTYAPDGAPRRPGPSRYGAGGGLSHRLDEDIDDLKRRLEALEQRH